MIRTPPIEVRRKLRKEVGFGCPIKGCHSPYLYWHHFDPPWHEREHHEPAGMIALCAEHHKKADSGAYTNDQLRSFKTSARNEFFEIQGSFDWMRNDLLAVVGNCFFYETPIILQVNNDPVMWFNRDESGYLLLNIKMLTTSQEERLYIEDNYWISTGEPLDLEVPPSGKLIKVHYSNGDYLQVEFFEIASRSEFSKKYNGVCISEEYCSFPITAVEIHNRVVDNNGIAILEFTPKWSSIPGISINGSLVINRCNIGIQLNSD